MSQELLPGVLEGQTVERDLVTTCDVCIVGSGAGGSTAAQNFARAGLKVVVVEEGGYFTTPRFRMREDEAYPWLYQDGGQRASKDASVAIYQGKAVGGGTVVNWTTCFRLPEDVLEHWKTQHGVSGFTASDLIPHYETVEKRLNIHKVGLDEINRNNRLLYDGCKTLGWEVDTLKRNVRGCARTGYCGLGCPVEAKQSMAVTFLPDAMNRGATVISRCRVDRLTKDGNRITGIRGHFMDAFGRHPTGLSIEVKAKRTILCAGAIGTPSVLLRSGLGSEAAMTGKRTFLHPVVASAAEYDDDVAGYYGAPQGAASHHFAHRGSEVGYFLEAVPLQPLFVSTGTGGYGKQHREVIQRLPKLAGIIALAIDGHHEEVDGGTVSLDADNNPVLDYTPHPKVFAAFRDALKNIAKLQLETGAKRIFTGHDPVDVITKTADIQKLDAALFRPNSIFVGSAHQMGGAMMGAKEKGAVVRSEDLRHQTLEDLYVMDGSVFPTSLGVNPQLSIYGLTHLMSSRLAAAWS